MYDTTAFDPFEMRWASSIRKFTCLGSPSQQTQISYTSWERGSTRGLAGDSHLSGELTESPEHCCWTPPVAARHRSVWQLSPSPCRTNVPGGLLANVPVKCSQSSPTCPQSVTTIKSQTNPPSHCYDAVTVLVT